MQFAGELLIATITGIASNLTQSPMSSYAIALHIEMNYSDWESCLCLCEYFISDVTVRLSIRLYIGFQR